MKLTRKISGWMLIACAATLMAVGATRAAGIPPLINYQGVLTNAAGVPVPDGKYAVTLAIYGVASGGNALWTETWPVLQTLAGGFSVMMGSITAIPPTFFSQHPKTYLGIKVGSDSEMTPRQQIGAVAYAFHAGNVEGSGVPSGGIIMWSGAVNQVPAGWALCNGQNGTPDLRDRFIVGAGTNYNVGSANGAGYTINLSHSHTINDHSHPVNGHVLTVNELPPHSHSFSTKNAGGESGVGESNTTGTTHTVNTSTVGGGAAHDHGLTGGATNRGTDTQLSSAQDIRPPYYALAFIMKL